MPKDEFDFDDPMQLSGVALRTEEDTTGAMCECFIEEFLRMGYNAKQVLALFGNPHYVGPNLALEKRGESFVRDLIADVFARWGKPVAWPDPGTGRHEEAQTSPTNLDIAEEPGLVTAASAVEMNENLTDPMGAPIPKLNL